MALEISRNLEWVYRQNPWNGKIIDRRQNRRGARWQSYATYPTEEIARTNLLALEVGRKRKEAGK